MIIYIITFINLLILLLLYFLRTGIIRKEENGKQTKSFDSQMVYIFRSIENAWSCPRVCLSGTLDSSIASWSGWLSNSRRKRGKVWGHRPSATFVNHHPFTFSPFPKRIHYKHFVSVMSQMPRTNLILSDSRFISRSMSFLWLIIVIQKR